MHLVHIAVDYALPKGKMQIPRLDSYYREIIIHF